MERTEMRIAERPCIVILATDFKGSVQFARELSKQGIVVEMEKKIFLKAETGQHSNWGYYYVITCTCTKQSGYSMLLVVTSYMGAQHQHTNTLITRPAIASSRLGFFFFFFFLKQKHYLITNSIFTSSCAVS